MIDIVAIDMHTAINALTRLHERLLECEIPDADHFVVLALANLAQALDGLGRLDRQRETEGRDDEPILRLVWRSASGEYGITVTESDDRPSVYVEEMRFRNSPENE